MKVGVIGLWHLGCVTAACLADMGVKVVGYTENLEDKNLLEQGHAPLFEPGLDDLIQHGIDRGLLTFTSDCYDIFKGTDYIWICYDTPVNEDDEADVDYVKNAVKQLTKFIEREVKIIVSSQLPVGSIRELEEYYAKNISKKVQFAYSPENLRLGNAINAFNTPDRIIVGVRNISEREEYSELFNKITDNVIWMNTESAEVVKHAINSFLAMSITFANEIASICEVVGADAAQVSVGLKSEKRIGPKAYVNPGSSFAGGTLARDVVFLNELGKNNQLILPLLGSIKASNDYHKLWTEQTITKIFGDNLKDKKIAVLGLAYKPQTSTLRRSLSVETCCHLAGRGARVIAFDPNITTLPAELNQIFILSNSIEEALQDSEVMIIATECQQFKSDVTNLLLQKMKYKKVIDANGFLDRKQLGMDVLVYSVGRISENIE